MTIEWTGPNQGKLRRALLILYATTRDLRRFVRDNFNYSLDDLSDLEGSNQETWAEQLIEKAFAEGWIDELYEQFCTSHQGRQEVARLKLELSEELIPSPKDKNFSEQDWEELFKYFREEDCLYLQLPFQFNSISIIREQLKRYDSPVLAVRFVERTIAKIAQFDEDTTRDLTPLKQWRDRMAKKYSIPPEVSEATPTAGYLLVAIKESGRSSQGTSDVTLFPELRIAGQPDPIEFNVEPITCNLKDIGEPLSQYIHQAENRLISHKCYQVTLELFLPCNFLEENVAEWEVQDRRGNQELLKYRSFIIRSLDRVLSMRSDPTLLPLLTQNWELLEECSAGRSPNEYFYTKKDCPCPGELKALLRRKAGLKLVGPLPDDVKQRTVVFFNIIDSAVPLALWTNNADCLPDEILREFKEILDGVCLTDFAVVAERLMLRRAESNSEAIRKLGALFDCPKRWPTNLPNTSQDSTNDDLLVAF